MNRIGQWPSTTLSVTGVTAVGELTGISMYALSTEYAGTKALLSYSYQNLINGEQNIDLLDVAFDAYTAPGLNALASSYFDWKPFSGDYSLQSPLLGNKGLAATEVDFAVGFVAGTCMDKVNTKINFGTSAGYWLLNVYPEMIKQYTNAKLNEKVNK